MRNLKRSNVVSVRPQGIKRTDYWFLPPRDEEAAKILDKFEQEENNEEGIREKNKREEVTEEKLGNIKNKSSDSSVGRVTVLPFFLIMTRQTTDQSTKKPTDGHWRVYKVVTLPIMNKKMYNALLTLSSQAFQKNTENCEKSN